MLGVNEYHRQLTAQDIAAGEHRNFVGGMWDVIGPLQFTFMKNVGLRPEHKLADVGCGSLRGGVHFIRYLNPGNYYGLDINQSLLDGAAVEVSDAGLTDKAPKLLRADDFTVAQFGVKFDYAISVSLFTHLFLNHIVRCLTCVAIALKPGGKYFSTFFEAPRSPCLETITHQPGGIVTNYDSNPFHYSFAELEYAGRLAGLRCERIGDWGHPRAQKMLCFTHS